MPLTRELITFFTPWMAFSLAVSDKGLLLEHDKQINIMAAIMNLVFIGLGI
jgi:hypothetical protein